MDVKYSYILPCYNVAGCISECLDSIFKNDSVSYEVIIVNDGSPDNLNSVLSGYFNTELSDGANAIDFGGRSVTVWCGENAGVSNARNRGMELAKGEYFLFADPDDMLSDNSLEIIDSAVKDGSPDLLITGFKRRVRENGKLIEYAYTPMDGLNAETAEETMKNVFPRFFGFSVENIEKWGSGEASLPSQAEFGSVWRCAFRAEIIRKNGIRFNPDIILHEDGMFICDFLTCAEKVVSVNGCTYIYNSEGGAMSATLLDKSKRLKLYNNKVKLLEFRSSLCEKLASQNRGGGLETYAGSNAMSCLELMARFPFGEYKVIKPYIKNPVVKKSVKLMPKTKDFKFNLAMFMLRHGLSYALFAAVRIASLFGVKF